MFFLEIKKANKLRYRQKSFNSVIDQLRCRRRKSENNFYIFKNLFLIQKADKIYFLKRRLL
ncbi:hypothetical protein Q757_06975 [Oenococcus alcoholitolerans]|uniref:Uncharacterized protein n=1 Tax=Oenococcus alcoholitolerans TaxID=931074 RepID=A0ABR4XPT9_9LACO|nr:hypothetical protein Q757_06975 [Oenococcus alcoholitolerans]